MLMQTLVAHLMTRDFWCASPELTLADLTRELVERRITGAPVVSARGELVGIVSLVDVAVVAVGSPTAAQQTVAEVMRTQLVSIDQSAPIREAAELFRRERVHRLVVTRTDPAGALEVVGVLSVVDLLGLLVGSEGPVPEPERPPESASAVRRTWI